MKTVVMSIGIPGSGKTTVLRKLAEDHALAYICPDDIREELTGAMTDHSRDREAWDLARARLDAALAAGKSVVVDATFTHPRTRAEFVRYVRSLAPERLYVLVFDVPLAVAKERNALRTRVVSDEQLEMRHRLLSETPPSLAEGFDALYTLDELPALIAALDTGR